jgi:hypothetical protein
MVTIKLVTRKKMSTQLHLGLRPQCFVYALYKTYTSIWTALGTKMVRDAMYVFKDVKRLGTENTK